MASSKVGLSFSGTTGTNYGASYNCKSKQMSKNFVRELRAAVGMSQVAFAQAIGRSLQTVRLYEQGIPPPPDIIERLKSIAREHGLDFPSDTQPAAPQPSGSSLKGRTPPQAADNSAFAHAHYRPENRALHNMLEHVLNSGVKTAIDAVVPDLIAFTALVDRMTGGKHKEKERMG